MSSQGRAAVDVLYDSPDGSDSAADYPKVDIVAVHGLGSNVDWSWTHRDRTTGSLRNWLKDADMLPSKIQNSRIMVYNYESRWHTRAPRLRLQTCGEDLVHHLSYFRENAKNRPIIFIGHSLGGLIIEHALLSSDKQPGRERLVDRTRGFIALGTPFKGTEMQGVASFAARLMQPFGSWSGIINDLEPNIASLRDKLRDFIELYERNSFHVCCFFETNLTDFSTRLPRPLNLVLGRFVQGMFVEEVSACPENWQRVQLQANHLELNKFSGPDDRSFSSVSAEILQMCKGPREAQKKSVQGHWVVPFDRNEDFVGREDILGTLLERLPPSANRDACQWTVLEGLGGVGKSHIALEASFRLRSINPSCSVYWVPAIDATSFEGAYRNIGRKLELPNIGEPEIDVKPLVQAALSDKDAGEWLLIVDNADDLDLIFDSFNASAYLPRNTSGSILFTTRTREVTHRLDVPAAGIMKVTKMVRDDSLKMMRVKLKESDMQDIKSFDGILDFLDDLPLAVRQASAYLYKTGTPAATYLKLCQSSDSTFVELLSREFEDRGRYDQKTNPIAATWLISFTQLSAANRRAGEYLRFMCFLVEKDIPTSILPPADNEIEAGEAIGALEAYGFITRREDGLCVDMHRLVRVATRAWLVKENVAQHTFASVVQRLLEVLPQNPEYANRELWLPYLGHAESVVAFHLECEIGAFSDLLVLVGTCQYLQGRYQEAAKTNRQALHLRKEVLGNEDPALLFSMSDLALMLNKLGRYEEAEVFHREALDLATKSFGEENALTLTCMSGMGTVLMRRGLLEEAERLFRHTWALREEILGKEHPATLTTMSDTAIVLDLLGQQEEAEILHFKVLRLREKVLGSDFPDTLSSMDNVANVLSRKGKPDEAEDMLRKVLERKANSLGKKHPSTLQTMHNMACMLWEGGSDQKAEEMFRETWELKVEAIGELHPSTALTFNGLQEILQARKEFYGLQSSS